MELMFVVVVVVVVVEEGRDRSSREACECEFIFYCQGVGHYLISFFTIALKQKTEALTLNFITIRHVELASSGQKFHSKSWSRCFYLQPGFFEVLVVFSRTLRILLTFYFCIILITQKYSHTK
jgi:hypothetical protein